MEPKEAHETSLRGYAPLVDRSGQSSSAALPERALCLELGDLFFTHNLMGIPSLFHKTSFLASLEDGSLPKILFFAVIGLSARFSTHPSLAAIHPWDRGRPYVREAEKLLDLHEVSLVTIQACILLAANVMADGEAMTECIYYGIACRIALLLDLPNRPAKTQVEQELNRRGCFLAYTASLQDFPNCCY
jgi:hypothetical protein